MTFVFPILLGGLALIAAPILIHLIMRRKPKIIKFPAFRFLVQRHRSNQRKLQLRHLLLLFMRILLLALICLALARPKIFSDQLNLRSDRPFAVVLVFDTSYSMEYKRTGGQTRLADAKKRALELLEEIPPRSKIAVLDTADGILSGNSEWLPNLRQARLRIQSLRLRHKNNPLTLRLQEAYRMFGELAMNREDGKTKRLPRMLVVFSDRMDACWDSSQVPNLLEKSDAIPPPLENLQAIADNFPGRIEELQKLRELLPPPSGKDYPEQALVDALQEIRDLAPRENPVLYPSPELHKQLQRSHALTRDLLKLIQLQSTDDLSEDKKNYRDQLLDSLTTTRRELRGVYTILVDVGLEEPTDLAVVGLQFPERQLFSPEERFILKAKVRATGNNFDTTLLCEIGGKTLSQALAIDAGETKFVPFEINCRQLAPRPQHLQVQTKGNDLLEFNNRRFASFGIRQARKILVLTDDPDGVQSKNPEEVKIPFTLPIDDYGKGRFRCVVQKGDQLGLIGPEELLGYEAIYLINLSKIPINFWNALQQYVEQGGSLGVIPGDQGVDGESYQNKIALSLLPGKFASIQKEEPGLVWNWDDPSIYKHPLLKPVKRWRLIGRDDFISIPRRAKFYWLVEPIGKQTYVIVRYDHKEKHPALLEREFGPGKGRVLMLTTRLDLNYQPLWNNYMNNDTSFCIFLPIFMTRYLAGDTKAEEFNFVLGQQEPVVRLPLQIQGRNLTVSGPGLLDTIPRPEDTAQLEIVKATEPGNFSVEDSRKNIIGGFSMNVPEKESRLRKVPLAEVEQLLGPESVINLDQSTNIREGLQDHLSDPFELFPLLMVALLVLLAGENLLANLFYRKEPQVQTEGNS